MIRGFFYLLQWGMLTGLAVWLLAQPGQFDMTLGPYRLQGETAFFALFLFTFLLVSLILQRVWLWVVHLPREVRRYRDRVRLVKGHQALSRGLSALAAGDTGMAALQAKRAQKLLPCYVTVPHIMLANVAEAEGHTTAARLAMTDLLKTEARDIGVRGLVKAALRENRLEDGLRLARAALAHAPSEIQLERLVYDLECQSGLWDQALIRLPRLMKRRGIATALGRTHQVMIETARGRAALAAGQARTALRSARAAFALDPGFAPAACLLIDVYRGFGKTSRAIKVLRRAYTVAPHPDLLDRHLLMKPEGRDATRRMKYHEDLLALHPDFAPAQLMLARAAMDEGMWREADAYLSQAEKLSPNRALYVLRSRRHDLVGDARAAQDDLTRGLTALPDPTWVCTRTGRTFPEWVPLVEPEHYFGTVEWRQVA